MNTQDDSQRISTAPPRRGEVCLNGNWATGGPVPRYLPAEDSFDYTYFPEIAHETLKRSVAVPADWEDRTVKVEFGAANFSAEVSVDGERVGGHIGGWVPFAVDVTDRVQAGRSFDLQVDLTGRAECPYSDDRGYPLWPVGDIKAVMDNRFTGLVDDVNLRAYGLVHIEEVQIIPSYREAALTAVYTVRNRTNRPVSARVGHVVLDTESGDRALSGESAEVSLGAGEATRLKIRVPWSRPRLWHPGAPHLYHLVSSVIVEGVPVDTETRRFGFREIWVEGTNFMLNGVRLNLRGDFCEIGEDWPVVYFRPENWSATVDELQGLNLNSFRPHKYPAPQ